MGDRRDAPPGPSAVRCAVILTQDPSKGRVTLQTCHLLYIPWLACMCFACRTSAAAIHGKALDSDPSSMDAAAGDARGAGDVTLGRLVAGTEWRRPLAANWSGIAGLCSSCRGAL